MILMADRCASRGVATKKHKKTQKRKALRSSIARCSVIFSMRIPAAADMRSAGIPFVVSEEEALDGLAPCYLYRFRRVRTGLRLVGELIATRFSLRSTIGMCTIQPQATQFVGV